MDSKKNIIESSERVTTLLLLVLDEKDIVKRINHLKELLSLSIIFPSKLSNLITIYGNTIHKNVLEIQQYNIKVSKQYFKRLLSQQEQIRHNLKTILSK